jgi:hypothetical protein
LLIEAALFMGPILEEQGSRMNMRKSRVMYYGASAMPEETQEAVKKAGLTFVTRDSTISGEARKQHYIHGVPVGPSSDGIAEMVLQDAREKTQSLEKITLLPVQDAMVVLRKTAFAMMNYITRCCTPAEARRATEHFDEEVLKYLCEIHATSPKEGAHSINSGGDAQPIDDRRYQDLVATAPVTAAGITFLASVAMALPTMRKIVGDDGAYKYFEDTLRDVRVKHTYLNRSIPESTV